MEAKKDCMSRNTVSFHYWLSHYYSWLVTWLQLSFNLRSWVLQLIGYLVANQDLSTPICIVVTEMSVEFILFPYHTKLGNLAVNALSLGKFNSWKQPSVLQPHTLLPTVLKLLFCLCAPETSVMINTACLELPHGQSANMQSKQLISAHTSWRPLFKRKPLLPKWPYQESSSQDVDLCCFAHSHASSGCWKRRQL